MILGNIKKELADEINKILEENIITENSIVYPPQKEMGDLSLPCFDMAKSLKKSPNDIAADLAERVKTRDMFTEIKAEGPYLNAYLNHEYINKIVLETINKENSGFGLSKKNQNYKIMIEYSNVNTHKEYHVGHLRNICYGEATTRILSANGFDAIPVNYINDFGIHVAKTLWNLDNYLVENYPGENIEKFSDKKKGFVLGKAYADAAAKSKDDEEAQKEISEIMKKIESRDSEKYKLWETTRKWNINQFEEIYKELDVKFDDYFYESEYIDEGVKIVHELVNKGILEKSEGAIIANLEKYDLGVLVVVRSDGTMMYPVADLALAKAKLDKHYPDESIYVVDNRQTLYFKQLFKVLELIGYKQKFVHLSHDFVKLPGGMMSSRSGNVITYEELKEQVFEKAKNETKKRHGDWDEEKIKEVAKKIGFGAIKFEMLKVDSNNVIIFDLDKALSFDGFTSAYIQYTFARINSVIKKAGLDETGLNFNSKNLKEREEKDLIIKLAKYEEVVKKAGDDYDPSEVAKYLFELARLFNDYYHKISVLNSGEKTKKARLALLNSTKTVLKNGLNLLAVDVMEEM